MNCRVHFFLLNEHFSPEYAEANYGGEESELNRRYEWEDELNITTPVSDVVEHGDAVYPLQGSMPDGEPFSFDVKHMRLLELVSSDGSTWIGCSERILDSIVIERNDGNLFVKVYLKDFEPMSNPIPGIYIAAQEFPKELIR